MTETLPVNTSANDEGKPAALWEDFVDVFTNPSAVFARRRDGAYAGGLTILASLSAIVFVATRAFWQPFFDHQMQAAFAAQQAAGKLTAEQVEQARGAMEKFTGVMTWITGIVSTPVAVMLVALLVMGAAHLVGAKLNYGQSLVAATLAYVPRVLAFAFGAGILAVKDPTTLPLGAAPTSPAALLPATTSQIAVGLLNRFDPFILWGTLLIGIGVAVLGRVARAKGYQTAAMVWGFATLFALLNALRTAAAAG
jgi:hypothetical protein